MNEKEKQDSWKPIPTKKTTAVDEIIKALTGFGRKEAINERVCVFCAKPVTLDSFKDELSLKEYHIGGMCQECQDKVYEGGPE